MMGPGRDPSVAARAAQSQDLFVNTQDVRLIRRRRVRTPRGRPQGSRVPHRGPRQGCPVRRTVRTSATAEATSASPATSTEVRISDYSKPLVEIDTLSIIPPDLGRPDANRAPGATRCASPPETVSEKFHSLFVTDIPALLLSDGPRSTTSAWPTPRLLHDENNEHFPEVLRERRRFYRETSKEQDFWIVPNPAFLDAMRT